MSSNGPFGQPGDGAYDRAFSRMAAAIRKPGLRFWVLAGLAYIPVGSAALCLLFYTSYVDSSLRRDLLLSQAVRDGLGNSMLFALPYAALAILLVTTARRGGWWRVLRVTVLVAYSLWNLMWIGFGLGIPFIPTSLAAIAAFVAVPGRASAVARPSSPAST